MRACHATSLLIVAACTAGCSTSPVLLTADGDLVVVTLDGAPFAAVHTAAEPRPFVFPVLGPGGVAMTRSFPMADGPNEEHDHPHHQSLWFAHGDVNGCDFWAGKAHGERIVRDGPPVLDGQRLRCRYRWLADEVLVASEEREWTFGGSDEARTIDVRAVLRPGDAPLVLGDTKEGTFAVRVHPALRVEGQVATGTLLDSEGRTGKAVWGQRARWIDDRGTIDGREVGIAMFDRPGNPSHPTWWHARTYGLLAANPFGVHDFEGKPAGTGAVTIAVGSSITFRYRVLLHGGGWDAPHIEAAYRQWLAE